MYIFEEEENKRKRYFIRAAIGTSSPDPEVNQTNLLEGKRCRTKNISLT